MNTKTPLEKVREKLKQTGPDSALAGLAALSVDSLLSHRLSDLVSASAIVVSMRAVLLAWLDAPQAPTVLLRIVEHVVHRLQSERRPLKDSLATELVAVARQVVARPFSPDRALVLSIIDRGPMRELVRSILLEEVLEFGRRASAPVAGMARGLGALARFAGETVKSRTGRVGSLVGAVGDEVERQLEKRASEFVDAALGNVFSQIADSIADPRRALEAAELRVAMFDGALELTGPQLARELLNADLPGASALLRTGLRTYLSSPKAERELLDLANFVFALEEGTLHDLLGRLGVLTPVRAFIIEQATERMQHVAQGEPFAAWLSALLAD